MRSLLETTFYYISLFSLIYIHVQETYKNQGKPNKSMRPLIPIACFHSILYNPFYKKLHLKNTEIIELPNLSQTSLCVIKNLIKIRHIQKSSKSLMLTEFRSLSTHFLIKEHLGNQGDLSIQLQGVSLLE